MNLVSFLVLIGGYLLGSIPTAYIVGKRLRGIDIRRVGDGNSGARNAWWELGARAGIVIFLIDVSKGIFVILLARLLQVSEAVLLLAGIFALFGHNFPVFLNFRGGRGEATTIGILLAIVFQPMLIAGSLSLLILIWKRNVILASAFLFIPLPVICWWQGVPLLTIGYILLLPVMVALTHLMRVINKPVV